MCHLNFKFKNNDISCVSKTYNTEPSINLKLFRVYQSNVFFLFNDVSINQNYPSRSWHCQRQSRSSTADNASGRDIFGIFRKLSAGLTYSICVLMLLSIIALFCILSALYDLFHLC